MRRRTNPRAPSSVCRALVITSLIALVCLVLWCTPMPDPYFQSCERPCNELDWPMICRFKFIVEDYQTMTSACGNCRDNSSACLSRECVMGDGTSSTILTVNRMFPGPTLQVCENDIVVVDVVNRLPGRSLGIHWGGQDQREFPFMDGVPGVTQCAIPPRATFQYKFRATSAGTHLWAATAVDDLGTLSGPLIVHQSPNREPHKDLYDYGDNDFVLTINVWKDEIFLNGRANPDNILGLPFAIFTVKSGSRKRLRILHAGDDPTGIPLNVSLDNHQIQLISLDGSPIEPKNVSSLHLSPGERADVVVCFDQPADEYMIRVHRDVSEGHRRISGGALIIYENARPVSEPRTKERTPLQDNPPKNLRALRDIPTELAAPKLENTIYLPFDFKSCGKISRSAQLTERKLAPLDTAHPASPEMAAEATSQPWPQLVPRINNITFTFGLSPLLTQPADAVAEGTMCRADEISKLAAKAAAAGNACECVHVIDIPLGAPVEVVLIDQGGDEQNHHVFTLHGNKGFLVGEGKWKGGSATATELRALDEQGKLLTRNIEKPVLKDVFSVPPMGILSFRFVADNPGYWLLHDQNTYRGPNALAVVLHVGADTNLPPVPENFPTCANFIGPEFFLM